MPASRPRGFGWNLPDDARKLLLKVPDERPGVAADILLDEGVRHAAVTPGALSVPPVGPSGGLPNVAGRVARTVVDLASGDPRTVAGERWTALWQHSGGADAVRARCRSCQVPAL